MTTKYQQLVVPRLTEIPELLASDATESGVAEALGVSPRTLRRYRRASPELDELFRSRAAGEDDLVESALLRRATGYEDAAGKSVPPDVRAAVFWLQNRRPKRWKRAGTGRRGKRSAAPEIRLIAEESSL